MSKARITLLIAFFLSLGCEGCSSALGRPQPNSEVIPPDKILDFDVLYASNCAGCHGPNGAGGASISLGNPEYLALADDATIRNVTAKGVSRTLMPAFAENSGGTLTDEQIDALVQGMRSHWAKPTGSANLPPYRPQTTGDSKRGANVYSVFCSSCHGVNGQGGPHGGSIVDGSYLSLVSDQGLRTTVILGRPELGFPNSNNDVSGRPMSSQDVSDVVAWLSAKRPEFPGQPYASAQN